MSLPPTHYQRRYYLHRLRGGGDLETLTAVMIEDGYTPAASWFQRWDEAAERRGLQLERQMGLACTGVTRPEFLNEAMRQLMRQMARQPAPPTLSIPPGAAPLQAEPALSTLPAV